MSQTQPFQLRWGIISTGGIATTFTKDLLLDPSVRGTTDVQHVFAAVGSRSVESAQKFISNVCEDKNVASKVQAFGTYQEVYDCKDVDAIYIGTPHTFHYENTKDALNAGKHVLCEKPFTFDTAELDELIQLAKSKKLFLMEAVWTRFHPIVKPLQEDVFGGKYGNLQRMFADLSFNIKPDTLDENHRMIDPKLGGGALLDLGPYPMVWTMLMMHQNPQNKGKKAPRSVTAHMDLLPRNGVDASSTWVVDWEGVGQSICTASMALMGSTRQSCILQLEKADIYLACPTYAPESYTIYPKPSEKNDPLPESTDGEKKEFPIHHGRGMHYQADFVARSIRDGKTECEYCDLDESRIVMQVFDEVRKQGNYVVREGKAGKA